VLIVESARRLRRWAWVESRLFEVVGGWATDTEEPDVARWFATVAHHHAWRASLWSERVPVLHDVGPDPVPGEWVALVDAAAAPTETALRLAGLADGVLPALLEEYEATLASAAEVSDGPVARALRLAVPDVSEDRQSAVALLVVAPDHERLADHRSSLATLRAGRQIS
jgi:hypothetical protein